MSISDLEFGDSEDEPSSPVVPYKGQAVEDTQLTPSTCEAHDSANPRQLFYSREIPNVLVDVANSNAKRMKLQNDILQEVKKTNSSLSEFSSRLDAVESRLKNVEEQQLASLSSDADTSVEKVKRKVPARVRVSS